MVDKQELGQLPLSKEANINLPQPGTIESQANLKTSSTSQPSPGASPPLATPRADTLDAGQRPGTSGLCIDANQAFQSQKAIGEEIRAVRHLSKRFVEQTQRWGGAVRSCDAALRELGDFQNYLSVIEQEMEELAGLLERIAERRAQQADQSPRS